MSTNVDKLTVKTLDNFIVPILEVITLFNDDEPEIKNYSPLTIVFTGGSEYGELSGIVVDSDHMRVDALDWGGVSSGSMFDQLELLFSRSTGKFVAIVIWEGGDIERITVENGQINREVLDL